MDAPFSLLSSCLPVPQGRALADVYSLFLSDWEYLKDREFPPNIKPRGSGSKHGACSPFSTVDYVPVPPSFPDVFLKWIKYSPVFTPGFVLYPLRQLAKGRIYFLLIYTCLPHSLSPGGRCAVSPCQSVVGAAAFASE